MMRATQRALVAFAAVLLVAPVVSLATPAPAVLGGEGELYRLSQATGATGDPTLVLSTQRTDGSTELVTVPGTEDAGIESSPYLIFEPSSQTLFLTWEERFNFLHQRIRLIGYHERQWSEVIDVAIDAFALKGEPSLAATHDSFVRLGEDGAAETVNLTTLHVTWVEQGSLGQMIAYAPVTLVDGRYVGHHPIIDLSTIVGAEAASAADLWQLTPPSVSAGDDDHSVVFGFVDPRTGRVATVRLTTLSGELAVLADELRSHLIDFGARIDWSAPEGLRHLADELRSHLIDFGHRVDPQILRSMANDLRSHLIDFGAQYEPNELRRMASDLRSHLIDFGFRLEDRGLRVATASAAASRIEVAAAPETPEEPSEATQVAEARPVATWSLPPEATASSILLNSKSGREILLAWEQDGVTFYRETADGEWGAVRRLPGSTGLGNDDEIRILENRIRNR